MRSRQGLWGDHVKDWHLGAHIANATARVGLDLDEMEAAIAGKENLLEAEIAINQVDEEAAGHWGTPCLVVDDEPFFGQDRIDMAVWPMKQKGRVRRE